MKSLSVLQQVDGVAAATLASDAYIRIRSDILRAQLAPGEKLRIESLRQRYGVGGSPVREALNRLSAEGLVVQEDQRGFRVAAASLKEMEDLTRARRWVHEITIRESLTSGDASWEESVLVAFHRLSRVEWQADKSVEIDSEWDKLHREFHLAILSACGSRLMMGFAEMLFDRADRYRHISAQSHSRRDALEEHRQIMQAVIERDIETTIRLMDEHLSRTANLVTAMIC